MIYFDNAATTPVDRIVLEAMLPYFSEEYGNASSKLHSAGTKAKYAVESAKKQIAELISCDSDEIIFTSGATESLNLALKGLSFANPERTQVITTLTEHKAVLDTCEFLESIGLSIIYAPVDENGVIDVGFVRENANEQTLAICVIYVNNETGAINPIIEVTEIANSIGAKSVVDATQAIGHVHCDFKEFNIDLAAFSAHKFHGPKGIGALYVKKGTQIHPLIHGGGHQRGYRSGTLNVPAIVGMGVAANLISIHEKQYSSYLMKLQSYFESQVLSLGNTKINCSNADRSNHISSVQFFGQDGDVLVESIEQIAASTGSACTSWVIEPSHVLKAMGLSKEEANSTVRFSFSRFNTTSEIDECISLIRSNIRQ